MNKEEEFTIEHAEKVANKLKELGYSAFKEKYFEINAMDIDIVGWVWFMVGTITFHYYSNWNSMKCGRMDTFDKDQAIADPRAKIMKEALDFAYKKDIETATKRTMQKIESM